MSVGLSAGWASALTYTWDVNGAATGTGGSGDWNTTDAFWDSGSGFVQWTDGNDAVLGGTGGTVKLKQNVTANSLTLSVNGVYTLDLNGFNLTATTGVTGHQLNTISNSSAILSTITTTGFNSPTIDGNVSVVKNGAAVWNSSVNQTFTGKLVIQAGEIIAANPNTLGASSSVTRMEGGKLTFGSANADKTATYTHNIEMIGAATLNAADKIITLSGNITGSAALTRQGSGTLILSGDNSGYSGAIGYSSADGTLIVGSSTGLGTNTSNTLSLQAGGSTGVTLGFQGNINVNLTNKLIDIPQAIGNNGKGLIHNFAGNNTISAKFQLSNTTITFGAEANTSLVLAGKVLGTSSRGFYKIGPGMVVLGSSTNEYRGVTVVRNGTLGIGADAPFGDGTTNSGSYGALGNQSFSGGNVLVAMGDGVNTAAGDNLAIMITGPYEVERPIRVRNDNTSGTSTVGGINTSGTAVFTSAITLNRDVILSSAVGGQVDFRPDTSTPFAVNAANLAPGIISGAFNVTVDGGGTVRLAAANTFGGAGKNVTVKNGTTLMVANSGNLGDASNGLILDNGTLKFESAFDASTQRTLSVATGGAGFDTNGNNVTFATAIGSTTGGVTKKGNGVLTLSGANAYSGATVIVGGTLALAAGSTLANTSSITVGDTPSHSSAALDVTAGGLTIGGAATQTLLGHGSVLGNVTLSTSGKLAPGTGGVGTLTTGGLSLASGSTTSIDIGGLSNGTFDKVVNTSGTISYGGTLALNFSQNFGHGVSWDIFDGVPVDGTTFSTIIDLSNSYQSSELSFDPTTGVVSAPEPSSLGLLLGATALLRRRRKVTEIACKSGSEVQ